MKILASLLLTTHLLSGLQTPAVVGEIKVLTLNTWGLPFPLGQKLDERIPRIARAIEGYDVVLLQETFDDRFRKLPALTSYKHMYFPDYGHVGHVRSGLMTLSKYPITASQFETFKNCLYPDCMAHKGVAYTQIMHPQLGRVELYNTHYQSRRNDSATRIRMESDNALMAQMVFQNHQYNPTILAGDFNFTPASPEYKDLMRRMTLIDTFKVKLNRDKKEKGTIRYPYHTNKTWNRIDYIFAMDNALVEQEVIHSEVMFNNPYEDMYLSDHNGVYSHIRFKRKSL